MHKRLAEKIAEKFKALQGINNLEFDSWFVDLKETVYNTLY